MFGTCSENETYKDTMITPVKRILFILDVEFFFLMMT